MLTSDETQDIDQIALGTAARLSQNGLESGLADALANGPRHPDASMLSRYACLGAVSFGFMIMLFLVLLFYRPVMVCGELTANVGVALLVGIFAWIILAASALYLGATKLSQEGRSALFLAWIEEESGNGAYLYFVSRLARKKLTFNSADEFIRLFLAYQSRVTLWLGMPLAVLAVSAFAFLPSTCLS